jgi:microcystin-dependent protein
VATVIGKTSDRIDQLLGDLIIKVEQADGRLLVTTRDGAVTDVGPSGGEGGGSITIADVVGLTDELASKASTSHHHDERYYTEGEVNSALANKANTSHVHDDRYYTESEVNSALAGKANTSHGHPISDVTNLSAALDGKSSTTHTHVKSQITDLALHEGVRLLNPAGLSSFYAAVAQRKTRPARVVFFGSSTTAGASATSTDKRYVNRLISELQASYPSGGVETPVMGYSAGVASPPPAPGIQGFNGGISGADSSNYAQSGMQYLGYLDTDLVVHMVGSNDSVIPIAPADYKANIEAVIDYANDRRSHLLIHTYRRYYHPVNQATWALYGQALAEIASSRPNVAFLDVSGFFEDQIMTFDPLDLISTDNVHMTDNGHEYMAQLICRALSVPVLSDAFAAKAALVHTHDDRYYTESEVNSALAGKANTAHAHPISDVTGLSTALDGKAPTSHTHLKAQITDLAQATEAVAGLVELATLAEATAGVDTSRAMTSAGVKAAINAVVDAAPGALDTLNELAAALGDDPNFATTMTTALAGKANSSHPHTLTDLTGGVLTPPLVQERIATPSAPAANRQALYPKADGKYYIIGNDGVERPLIPAPSQLHLNASLDSVANSTVGSVESGSVASRLMPTGWSWYWASDQGGTAPSLVADAVNTLNGVGYSVKVTFPHLSGQTLSSSVWGVVPDSLITVSAWVKGSGPRVYLSILTGPSGAAPDFFVSGTINSDTTTIVPNGTWQKITHSFLVPAGHTQARFMMRGDAGYGSGVAGDIWWDESESSVQITPPAQVIPGEIKMWPSASAPNGYLLCNGGTFSSDTYPVLAALLGDTFGTHSGTTYYLPDFRGRTPLGVGTASPAVAGGTAHTLGQKGGEEKHTQTQAELAQHTHVQDAHSHTTKINTALINTRTAGGATFNVDSGGADVTSSTTATNQNTGSSTPFNVLDPFLGINFIIKAA